MHREHLLPSRSSQSPSREGFVTFQALLALESTFKDTNTEGSSKDMTAGIQRLPLDLHHLQWSAMQGRFLHGLPMLSRDQNLLRWEHAKHLHALGAVLV